MRVFHAALGVAGFLLVPWAFADYSFSFNTRDQHEHAGLSSGAWLAGGASGADSSSGKGGSGDGELADLSGFTMGFLAPSHINSDADLDSALDCFDSSSVLPNAPRYTDTCWLIAIAAFGSRPPVEPARAGFQPARRALPRPAILIRPRPASLPRLRRIRPTATRHSTCAAATRLR